MEDEYLYEGSVLSVLRGREGWDEQYDKISELKEHLDEAALADERLEFGWVLWRASERHDLDLYELYHHHSNYTTQLQIKVTRLFKHVASDPCLCSHYLVQFWAVVKVEEGQKHYLSTSHHPFCIGNLTKGLCWYRKLCMDHVYVVDVGKGADDQGLPGGVGRAFQSKHAESTPDLRLYSTLEFPMRDEAARCGLRGYLALPLFDLSNNELCGVIELVSGSALGAYQFSSLIEGLQIAGLRSTHTNFIANSQSKIHMLDKYKQQPESEIGEILEWAIKDVPQLYLAQVWIPCKQCANLICMERACFINARDKKVNLCNDIDADMFVYLQACEFHHLQVDPNYFHKNLCDLSISKNPLAHHAKRARLYLRFAISLQSVNNSNNDQYVIELFLQPKCSEDASLHPILSILEMKLKNFKFVPREQLPQELLQSKQPKAMEWGSVDMLDVTESFSELEFTRYLETGDSCSLGQSSEACEQRWVFSQAARDQLCESDVNSNSLLTLPKTLVKDKIENLMKKIATKVGRKYWIIQFWAPKMEGDKCYLQTSDQPYSLGCLAKGLASLRKRCMSHRYVVDEEAKEEELGPPGRAFKLGNPEISPDLFLYTIEEFPIRNYAVHCCLNEYFALPMFNEHNHKCVGVLELIGFSTSELKLIKNALEAATLCSIHIDLWLENDKPDTITNGREQALSEFRQTFPQMTNIPQLHMAKVWIPYEACASINSNTMCLELALSTKDMLFWDYMPKNQVKWIHVQPRKGIIGMALESESKSCFSQNLCEFSLGDQPMAHYQRRGRLDVCFAICLQSSHTEELLYVVEFFLYRSPDYLGSFLDFIMPIMKQQLKSFKYASGKQLGEELVVEVVEFSEATNSLTLSELGQPHLFPIKFKSVRYQQGEEKQVPCVSDVMQRRAKGEAGCRPSLEVLKQHFGKKLQDVAEELGVGRSTIKRACREYGIARWPNKILHKKNPSVFERDDGRNEGEKAMIKVSYKEDTIKFEMCLSLGVAKLFEEVGMGFKLEKDTFKLKYLDEDNDEILVSSDADLGYFPRMQTTTGETCIKLFVQLISDQADPSHFWSSLLSMVD